MRSRQGTPLNRCRTSVRPVVLIGHTGAGKSAIGTRLARLLDLPFFDSDRIVTNKHGEISDIFSLEGEPAFRRYEASAIAEAVTSNTSSYVLSVGGGAVMDPATRQLFKALTVVWLSVDLENVLPRLLQDANRPLMKGDVAGKWETYYLQRRPVYQELADITIDTSTSSVESLALELHNILSP